MELCTYLSFPRVVVSVEVILTTTSGSIDNQQAKGT